MSHPPCDPKGAPLSTHATSRLRHPHQQQTPLLERGQQIRPDSPTTHHQIAASTWHPGASVARRPCITFCLAPIILPSLAPVGAPCPSCRHARPISRPAAPVSFACPSVACDARSSGTLHTAIANCTCTSSRYLLTMPPAPPRTEYVALVGSFILVGLEAVIRVLTLALRTLETIRDTI